MLIRILAIGNKMPSWVREGCQDYLTRLTPFCRLELIEIPTIKRTKNSKIVDIIDQEGMQLLAATKSSHDIVALDLKGKAWSTSQFVEQFKYWQREGNPIDFLIGGPDGLSAACLQKAKKLWSLSPLTLPHPLVRLMVIEQLYRVVSILQNHPYHR